MLINACTEEFNLQLHPETKLVIDAEITNGKPPYYTHLGLSGTIESDLNQWVDNALVIISDDDGVVDTLIPAADSIWSHFTRYKTQSGEDSIVWYPVYDNIGVIDSMLVYDYKLSTQCYFQTTKLKGKAGHTYYLKVEWNGNTYTSECTMPSAIKIDTITHRQGNKLIDGTDGTIPYVWFHDNPNVDNYYVFKKEAASTLSHIQQVKAHGVSAFSAMSLCNPTQKEWTFVAVNRPKVGEKTIFHLQHFRIKN